MRPEMQDMYRLEAQHEADARCLADKKADAAGRRGQGWADKYKHLRLSHTMVLHKRKVGRRPEFTAVRRAVLAPPDAAAVRSQKWDMHLAGCTTWRKGGAQRIDGCWKQLRHNVSQRGYKTGHLLRLRRRSAFADGLNGQGLERTSSCPWARP